MRKILHVDMDAFFASVEQRDHPELIGKPVIVGGKARNRGVVSTCSYEARSFGVHSAMSTKEALKLCPKAVVIKPNIDLYRQVSQEVRAIFHRYTDLVEPLSIDEAYLDVTENKLGIKSATLCAQKIQYDIYQQLGLTCSVGVSFNKFLAKIASGYQKPSGITVVDDKDFQGFINHLKIEDFYGVGKVTAEKMRKKEIFTGADLLAVSKQELVQSFGKQGERLYQQVRGLSSDELTIDRQRKSLGKETTFIEDCFSERELVVTLEKYVKWIVDKLEKEGMVCKTVTLKLRNHKFQTTTKSKSLVNYTKDYDTLVRTMDYLFYEAYDEEPIRLVGLSVSNLLPKEQAFKQLSLFD
ncbi:DNA polymerase-4 [Granulicatella balaenopterae]|uniref:DNA polymerase IV n=1 Tax=Granulicatella balaenopterae TaxID=137733 RepID=A0A1H9MQM9_9LACT|nr:DNA polymerase IV [Granulicatella balaenopterae]SER25809.1 DNA polymerase-4 [Granulicatella balaenopterae]